MVRERLEHTWWVLHHSDDPDKRAMLLTCYADESGTDSDSSVAVVGGVMLDKSQFFWLDVAWRKCLDKHHIPWPLHMRDFGPRGKLKNLRSEERRALFKDVTKVINNNKAFSIVSTLNSDQYRVDFADLSELSMYGACFANLVMFNGLGAEMAQYRADIPYVLDTGNAYKHHIIDAHDLLRKSDLKTGTLAFDFDEALAALQAADVISWTQRRKQAAELKSGFEPLVDILNDRHFEASYKPEWMAKVANALRARMGA